MDPGMVVSLVLKLCAAKWDVKCVFNDMVIVVDRSPLHTFVAI